MRQISFGDADEVAVQGNKADVDRLLALLEEVYLEKVAASRPGRARGHGPPVRRTLTAPVCLGGRGSAFITEACVEHHFHQHQQEAAPLRDRPQGRQHPRASQDNRYGCEPKRARAQVAAGAVGAGRGRTTTDLMRAGRHDACVR